MTTYKFLHMISCFEVCQMQIVVLLGCFPGLVCSKDDVGLQECLLFTYS